MDFETVLKDIAISVATACILSITFGSIIYLILYLKG